MADILKARDGRDVEQAVTWAIAENRPLEIAGRGTKRALGRPSQSEVTLDLSGLTGVTLYEPEELVLSARAGTPIAEIEALVAASAQELAFEPMDFGPVLGAGAGQGTIGGVLAANLSGPRRIKAGAARDHFLGVTAVSGRGETFKSGGRVVKNVTGYDLCKLLAGSYGTLAAMTDVTIKTLPRAETEETIALSGLDESGAARAMAAAMGSSCDVSGAAYLPAPVAGNLGHLASGRSATLLRLEGVAPSVKHRRDALAALLKPYGAAQMIAADASRTLWRAIRDVLPFARAQERPLWRISVAPTMGPELGRMLSTQAGSAFFCDWAGGLVWLEVPHSADAGAETIRREVAKSGGHATLARAPAPTRAAIAVFEPQPEAAAALTQRVKEAFDPKGILNPGRMWAGH